MPETIGLRAVIDLRQFNAATSSYNKSLGRMNKNTTSFTSSAGQSFTGLGKSMLSVGAIAGGAALAGIAALTAGLIAFGRASVREGAAYTKAMSNVKAVSGATAEEFDLLTASAEELGKTTKFTAIEAAEGMSFLAMAGFEVVDIIGAMPGVLDLAAAGNLQLGRASDIVSNILTGFGADATQTGKFVDVLTKTFTSSNTTLEQLGQGMKFVAPVAADFGISVEDVAAAMGTMGDAGIQASMAGTGLRTILLKLASPTGKAKDLIKELGLEVFDAEGNMLPFPQVIGNVNKALTGMSQEQRAATLETLVGKRAISAFSILLKKGETGLQDFGDELRESGGTAAEIAATQLDNLSGDVTLFQSALSGIKIDVFKALEPLLRGVAKQGKVLLEAFGPQLVIVFGEITDAISGMISIGEELFSAFQAGGIGGLFTELGSQIQTAWIQIQPILSQLGQQFFAWITETAIPFAQQQIPILFNAIGQFIDENWPLVVERMGNLSGSFFDWINTNVIPKIPEVLTSVISGITSFLTENWPQIQETLDRWGDLFWGWVQRVAGQAGETLSGIIAAIGQWALSGETQSQLTEFGVAMGQNLVAGILELSSDQARMVEILTAITTGLLAAVGAVAGLLIVVGGQIVAGILEGVLESITGGEFEAATFNELGGILSGIASNALLAAKLIGKNIILGISQGILDTIDQLLTTLEQLGVIISETVKSALGISSPSTVFMEFGKSIIQGLISGIQSLAGNVIDIISSIFGGGAVGGGLEIDLTMFSKTLPETISANIVLIENMMTALGGLVSSLGTPLQTAMKKFQEAMVSGFSLVFNQLDMIVKTITLMITKLLPDLGLATGDATTEMEDALNVVVGILVEIERTLSLLAVTIGALSTNFDTISTSIDILTGKLGKVEDSAEDAADAFEDFRDSISIINNVKDAVNLLRDALKEVVTQAGLAQTALTDLGVTAPGGGSFVKPQPGASPVSAGRSSSVSTVNNTSTSTQIFNISFGSSEIGMSEAEAALLMRQNIQRQLSTV